MNNMWAITATVTKTRTINGNVFTTTRQIPTFYLCGDVQGIDNPIRAAVIAKEVINIYGDDEVNICAVKVCD